MSERTHRGPGRRNRRRNRNNDDNNQNHTSNLNGCVNPANPIQNMGLQPQNASYGLLKKWLMGEWGRWRAAAGAGG
jgi:hypothetical protein